MVEFRIDSLNNLNEIEDVANKKHWLAVATDRSNRPAATKEKLLLGAASAGFELIDVDVNFPQAEAFVRKVKSIGSKTILSFHDESRTPTSNELQKILESQTKIGGDLCKLVTTALHPRDNLRILNFLEEKPTGIKLITFAMGPLGVPSRILSPLFGAEFTFAALEGTSKTAEGQLTIDDLRSAWRLLGVQ